MNTDYQSNYQSRKWLLTINNPFEHGYSYDAIQKKMASMKSIIYYCMSCEKGETEHIHIYLVASSGIRFSTIKNKFPHAHLDASKGTSIQNRDYVFKTGKWEKDAKHETNNTESHYEWGTMPIERQGARNDLTDLYDLIKDGKSTYHILEEAPQFVFRCNEIDRARQVVLQERFKKEFRHLETIYVYGKTGTGKTRGVMDNFGYENVFRVTDSSHPFDNYLSEDVLIFEEFRNQIPISDMLNYLDGYPVTLKARYSNKVACYTKVFIISNLPLTEQYPYVQQQQFETWEAFLRRIHKVRIYTDTNTYKEYSTKEYISAFHPIWRNTKTPFDTEKEVC